jgi:hypothetical protein
LETTNWKMSSMNVYLEEDLLALNLMIDVQTYNFSKFEPINAIDPDGVWRLFRPGEIVGTPVKRILDKFINFLSPCLLTHDMTILIYKVPLESVPLYINKPDNLGLIARWRLQIGK